MTQHFSITNKFEFELNATGIVNHIRRQLKQKIPQWQKMIARNTYQFDEIERETMAFGREISGYLTAVVLDSEEAKEAIDKEATRIRKKSPQKLRNVYREGRKITLLSGLVLVVSSLYCVPRQPKKKRGKRKTKRGKEGVGIYPEWAALGISEGASPALREEVARNAVLMPSFGLAHEELSHHGIGINLKTTWRLTNELGQQALSYRREELEKWQRGELPAGDYVTGKTLAVSVDGGRTRTRVPRKRGRKTKKNRDRFDTPWREPKLMTIYLVGPDGKIDNQTEKIIEGTMQGPDHLMDLVAYHLHRFGATKAKRIVFLGDGADWIWNRYPRVIDRVGIERNRCLFSLDPCHAMSHIAEALKSMKGWDKKQRKKEQTRLKGLLLKGKVEKVLEYLGGLRGRKRKGDIVDAIAYLKKRIGLMDYGRLKRLKVPIGSGSIESAIRRVINLRIKNPGSFWEEENAERMMHLRAQRLSNHWEEMLHSVKRYSRYTRNHREDWNPTPYSLEEPGNSQLNIKPLLKSWKK